MLGGERDDAPPAFRRAHDAAQGRDPGLLEEPGRGAVGRDHEVLDQLLGTIRTVGAQLGERLAGEDRPRLDRLEIERPVLVALAPERLRDPVLGPDLYVHARRGGHGLRQGPGSLEPRGDRVVGQLRLVANARAVDLRAQDQSPGVHPQLDDHRQALCPRVERGEVGGEPRGEHREELRPRVDRRRVVARVLVDRRPLADHRIHIRHRDQGRDDAPPPLFDGGELIEVQRVIVVDRGPGQAGQVADGRPRLACWPVDGRQLFQHRRSKLGQQPPFLHRLPGDLAQVSTLVPGTRLHETAPRRARAARVGTRAGSE